MNGATKRMAAKDAIAAIHGARNARDVVITTMTPARDWMMLPQQPLDVVFVPSAMGHATSLGLGIALAQPSRQIIVCNGDGSMLMNLGSLVSIVGSAVTNIVVIVFENGVYEVTGAQPVPAAAADYAAFARGAGFSSVYEFDGLDEWRRDVEKILNAPGPTFVCLHVETLPGVPGPKSPGPAKVRAARLMEALQGSP